ncbi:alkaline phosphatase [filamentous cyanobacterium CCP5]|nr:alkaline phosphatase [filamentous cyanobacterium CCP5]
MLNWITDLIDGLGYWGIMALMCLENVLPPIPSELIMPLSGYASSRTDMTLFGVILAGTVGSILGTLPWYYLGRLVDQAVLLRWADRYGRWLAVSAADIERAMGWFQARKGAWTVGLARMVPGIRTYISVPAGLSDMKLPFYLLFSFIGSAIWVGALAIAGYLLGDQFERVSSYVGPASRIVIVLTVITALLWVIRRRVKAVRDL